MLRYHVKSRARRGVTFSLEPKQSCVWLLSRLRTAHFKRIPFYNTAKQWRTLALTSVDPSNTEFSLHSSLASLRQLQKASEQSSRAHHHSIRVRTKGGKHEVSKRQLKALSTGPTMPNNHANMTCSETCSYKTRTDN